MNITSKGFAMLNRHLTSVKGFDITTVHQPKHILVSIEFFQATIFSPRNDNETASISLNNSKRTNILGSEFSFTRTRSRIQILYQHIIPFSVRMDSGCGVPFGFVSQYLSLISASNYLKGKLLKASNFLIVFIHICCLSIKWN